MVTSVNSAHRSRRRSSPAARSPRVPPGHLLLRRGHLQRPGPQRRERQRLHPHLHRWRLTRRPRRTSRWPPGRPPSSSSPPSPRPPRTAGRLSAQQPVVKVEDSGGNVVTSVDSAPLRRRSRAAGLVATRHPGHRLQRRGHLRRPGPRRREPATCYTLTFTGDGFDYRRPRRTPSMATGAATQLVITTAPSATDEQRGSSGTNSPSSRWKTRVATWSPRSTRAPLPRRSPPAARSPRGGTSGTLTLHGVATFSGLALNGVSGNVYTLTFTGDGFTSAAPRVEHSRSPPGAATQLVIHHRAPATRGNGVAFSTNSPIVKVEDSGGNVVTSRRRPLR